MIGLLSSRSTTVMPNCSATRAHEIHTLVSMPPCKHGIGPHLLGIFGISLPYSKGIIFREENSAQYECQTVTMQYLGVSNYDKPVRYSVMRIISQICLIRQSWKSIRRHQMWTVDKQSVVTMQELVVSSLAQTDALCKLLIEKGLITKDEFMQKLSAERAVYQAMLERMG